MMKFMRGCGKGLFKLAVRLFVAVCLVVAVVAGGFAWQGWQTYKEAVTAMPLEQRLAEARAAENYTKLEDLPQTYLNAVVAVEDKRFYSHGGIDPISIGRAVLNDLRAGALVEGGSTISQQLAKNLYFTQEKRFERKFAEVFLALELERTCTKDEILELYVNGIYFGSGYYNIHDAAVGYYGKEPAELLPCECVMLAGLPNAPSAYSPRTNPTLAVQRQRQVLERMVNCQMLAEAEVAELNVMGRLVTEN